ncbi:hypothetical protein ASD24_20490 [Paenibacillus sp. Root52]|uniref:hypothetical protein n=1 Tax=Paenibacillus sp. Root52 TaxID=1736552 RepID=UPI0006F2F2BE|nr:hypothetical protein [Paenibacillus sp. Root52]KQY93552.1 hypothetical protein ASD24_20490 [Paenibacillus sp. Root52]
MRITCEAGTGFTIGMIALQPEALDVDCSSSQITNVVDPERIAIPYVEDEEYGACFDTMSMMEGTYQEEFGKSYDVEFTIDVDKNGYITEFEHTFPLERYIDLVQTQSYQVIRTNWRGRTFHVMTYGYPEEVRNPNNVIYRCTSEEDVFVVGEIVPYSTISSTGQRYGMLHFRALISARDDLYPLSYMCKPDFDLTIHASES